MELYLLIFSLLLCASSVWLALKKRSLPFALYVVFFIALTHIQGFYILKDLSESDETTFLLSHITRLGFYWSCWYLTVVSIILFFMAFLSSHIKAIQTPSFYYFKPSKIFYLAILSIQIISAYIAIFVLVGIDAFTEESRPGGTSGTSILLILTSVGIIPVTIRFLLNEIPKRIDLVCFILTNIATLFFSRIHVIVYAVIVGFAYYYGGGVYKIKSTTKFAIKTSLIFSSFLLFFVGIGALRDALNYTNFANILQYLIDNPNDATLLSVERNYRVSVEGMSGLASAMTTYFEAKLDVPFGAGLDWTILGVLRALPGVIKVYFDGINEILSPLNWHGLSIVAPGLESSFVSFFVFGPFVFSLMFYVIAWRFNKLIMNQKVSPFKRLATLIFIANGIFFVRGAWVHWLGFLVAFFIILFILRPLIQTSCKRRLEIIE